MRGTGRLGAAVAAVVIASAASAAAGGNGPSSNDGQTSSTRPPTGAAPTKQSAAQAVTPDGTLYFSIDNNGDLYSLDVNTAAATFLGKTGVTSNTVGLADTADPSKLVGSTWEDLTIINANGSGFATAGTNQMDAEGLAYDAVNNVLYKIINGNFATANQTTGATITTLTGPGHDLEGIEWRRTDGKVYGIGNGDTLYAYTPGTDTWAAVGHTGIVDTDAAGLAWDPGADALYAIFGDGLLFRIDPDTAAATEVGDTGLAAGGGLAFIANPAPPPAPVQVVVAPRFTG